MSSSPSSYRLIGTYSSNSQNLSAWGGPASFAAFTAAGTATPWGSTFQVSAFNIGATFGGGSTDVLNAGGFGYDELNLSALLAATSDYSVSNAAVFNWSPGNAGFGCDTFSAVVTGSTFAYNDTLAAPYWGEVRDYEASINTTAYVSGAAVNVSGFQITNLQITGGIATVVANNVQAGTYDFSKSSSALGNNLTIKTASDATQGSTQTYVIESANTGMTVTVANGTQATDYNGTALTTNGSTSLMDFYGSNIGADRIVLQNAISSNLYIVNDGSYGLQFISSGAAAWDGNSTWVDLSATGAGKAHISMAAPHCDVWVDNFQIGRDSLDMVMSSSAFEITSKNLPGTSGGSAANTLTMVSDPTGTYGVALSGMYSESLSGHVSTAVVGGVTHLYIN